MSERSETESERDLDNIEVGDEMLMIVMMMLMMPGPVRAGCGLQQEILPQEQGRGCGRQGRVLPSAISGEKRLE